MTPKEKAEELYDNFEEHSTYSFNENKKLSSKHHAKQCALIAVDEIINVAPNDKSIFGTDYLTVKEYWQRVKQEIQNL